MKRRFRSVSSIGTVALLLTVALAVLRADAQTRGGAIVQTLAWAGRPVGPGQLRVGVGGVRSLRGSGGLSSPLLELSWSQAFGLSGR